MHDYERTKTADHPGDTSLSDFALGYARALGTHLMDELGSATGLAWWFNSVEDKGEGRFVLDLAFMPGGGRRHNPNFDIRLTLLVAVAIRFPEVHIAMTLPYGGAAKFTAKPQEKPSAIASNLAHRLKDSFTGS